MEIPLSVHSHRRWHSRDTGQRSSIVKTVLGFTLVIVGIVGGILSGMLLLFGFMSVGVVPTEYFLSMCISGLFTVIGAVVMMLIELEEALEDHMEECNHSDNTSSTTN